MSPVRTAIRDQSGGRTVPVPPFPAPDLLRSLALEIVVDWQLSSEVERTR